MAKSTKAPVEVKSADVRAWARNIDLSTITDAKGKPVPTASILGADGTGTKVRGRVHPAFREAYMKAHPGTTFVEDHGSGNKSREVEVPLFSPKTGRPVKPVTLAVSEVRRLAGTEGKMGRLSSAELVAAGQAYQKAKASK